MSNRVNWSRRSFLTPRGLGTSSGGMLGTILQKDKPVKTNDDSKFGCWCISRRAMGCEFNVLLPPQVPHITTTGEAALGEIDHMVVWNEELFKTKSLSGKFTDEKLQVVSRLIHEASTAAN